MFKTAREGTLSVRGVRNVILFHSHRMNISELICKQDYFEFIV